MINLHFRVSPEVYARLRDQSEEIYSEGHPEGEFAVIPAQVFVRASRFPGVGIYIGPDSVSANFLVRMELDNPELTREVA